MGRETAQVKTPLNLHPRAPAGGLQSEKGRGYARGGVVICKVGVSSVVAPPPAVRSGRGAVAGAEWG